ncbi:MAG: hypothetical protein QXK12_01670 [Candidatus Nezhaarchaeales archaeon]
MVSTVKVDFAGRVKVFRVDEDPIPHITVPTVKEVVHGWFYGYENRGRRECSSERILVNPYNGCSVECPMCYARGFGGYFDLWNEKRVITVFEGIDEKCAFELDQLYVASCAYLSPVTDPFQRPLENTYGLSEKIAYAFLDRGLPVEFITKRGDNVPLRLLDRMAEHKYRHCFTQFSILSVDDDVRRVFSPGGATVEQQFKAVRRAVDRGLFTVVRMDPILPGITDSERSIRELVERAKKEGVKHVIFSVCDLGWKWRRRTLSVIKHYFPEALKVWREVYVEEGGSQACLSYREEVFRRAREVCDREGLTMSLCMEFKVELGKGGKTYVGLNSVYATSESCEGIDIPMYYRSSLSEAFKPMEGCRGNCLACAKHLNEPVCNEPKLAKASALKLSDYKRFKPRFNYNLLSHGLKARKAVEEVV